MIVLTDLGETVVLLALTRIVCEMAGLSAIPDANDTIDGDRLPGRDGYELVRRMKDRPEHAHIPVVFLTTGLHEYYHTVSDEVSEIDFGTGTRITGIEIPGFITRRGTVPPIRLIRAGSIL